MNDFKAYYPKPLKFNEEKGIFEEENVEKNTAEKGFNFENVFKELNKNPNDFLTTLLAKNFLGNPTQPNPILSDMLKNMITAQKTSTQKKSPDTIFEDF